MTCGQLLEEGLLVGLEAGEPVALGGDPVVERLKMGSGRYLLLLMRYVFRSSFWAVLARLETRQSSLRLSLAGSSGRGKAQVVVIRRINQENLMLGLSGDTQEHGIGFSEIRNCYTETEGWCQRDH